MNLHLLEQIENLADDMGYYGSLTIEMLDFQMRSHSDAGFAAAMVCGYYSDLDGGEVSDEFYERVIEAIEANV